jgi:hypothetical protein
MAETTTVIDHINTIRTLFSQLTTLGQQIEESEHAELLLQSLPDLDDQLIINLTNNILTNYLVFDDVAAAILEEENRRKNKETEIVQTKQRHYWCQEGDQRSVAPVGVKGKGGPNQEVRRL